MLPGRVYGPGRLPAYARFLGGVERPANLFRLGRLDRCAGSTRKRIEQNGLLSSSGVPSWGAKPDSTSRTGPRKPEGRYLGQFLPPERGSNVAGQQETQPTFSKQHGSMAHSGGLAQVAERKRKISSAPKSQGAIPTRGGQSPQSYTPVEPIRFQPSVLRHSE